MKDRIDENVEGRDAGNVKKLKISQLVTSTYTIRNSPRLTP
jgi:hypothetical protein